MIAWLPVVTDYVHFQQLKPAELCNCSTVNPSDEDQTLWLKLFPRYMLFKHFSASGADGRHIAKL